MSKRILHLTLKRKWFAMIASGEKKEEYREIGKLSPKTGKPTLWIENRLLNHYQEYVAFHKRTPDIDTFLPIWKVYDEVHYRNGYGKNDPFMRVEWLGVEIGMVNPDWAPPGTSGKFYVIEMGEVLELANYPKP